LRIEQSRFSQGFLLSILLKLGIRKMIPEKLDGVIAQFISKLRSNNKDLNAENNNAQKFSISDFRIEEKDVDSSLDLFAIANK